MFTWSYMLSKAAYSWVLSGSSKGTCRDTILLKDVYKVMIIPPPRKEGFNRVQKKPKPGIFRGAQKVTALER